MINFTSRNFSPLCKSELMIEGQLMKLTIFHNYLERGNNLQHHRQLPSQHNAGKIGKKIYNNHTAPKSEIFMFVSINTPNNAVMPKSTIKLIVKVIDKLDEHSRASLDIFLETNIKISRQLPGK